MRVKKIVDFLEAAGLAPSAVPKLIDTYPQILALSVEQRLRPTLKYLTRELKLSPAEAAQLIARAPAVLGLHPKRTLRPKIDFLVDDVGLEPTVLRQVLLRAPNLLSLSVDGHGAKLKRNLEFLLDVVGIAEHRLPRVIEKAPSLLSLSTCNNMQPILSFLSDPEGLGIEKARVASMIAAQVASRKQCIPCACAPFCAMALLVGLLWFLCVGHRLRPVSFPPQARISSHHLLEPQLICSNLIA